MGIWDSFRRFASISGTSRRLGFTRRGRGAATRSRHRDLRMERFEARVLLSISPTGDQQEILSWAPVETASDWVGDTQSLAFLSSADEETGALWVDFDGGDGLELGAPARVEVSNLAGQGIRGEVSIAGAWFETTTVGETEFVRLTIPGIGSTGVVGEPALPVVRGLLTVPEGADVTAEIAGDPRSLSTLDVGIDDLLVPVQPPVAKVEGAAEAATLELDEVVYATDANSLDAGIWLSEVGYVAGERLVMFEVVPISYNPVQESFTVFDTLTFDVSIEGGDGTKPVLSAREDARLADLALNHVAASTTKAGETKAPGRLLIISHDDFMAEMASFVTHKESLGWTVDLVSTTAVGGNTTTAIQSYIQGRYADPATRPDALLLVGDTDRIPYFVGQGWDNPNTDLYYACMDPGDDWQPEFPVGRFSVADSADLTAVIDKTIFYETSASGDWTNRATFIATDDLWFYPIAEGTHDWVINTYMDPLGYTSDKLYAISAGATTPDVRSAFNDGRALGIYSGHGYEFGWAGPSFTQADVSGLVNSQMYPFVGSFACLTGDFAQPESFMETWLREPDKGAVVAMGSSVTSLWDEDDILEKNLFDAMYGEGNLAFGSAMMRAKELYLQYWGSGSTTRRYFEMYNLLGDPTVELVTRAPVARVGPELVAIIPNEGDLLEDGEVLNIAPRELLFRFNEGQTIDPATLDAIQIVRTGGDGIFGNANDVIVEYGWIDIADYANEVIVRFADTLPDDRYEIRIVGSNTYVGPDNQPVAPLLNMSGLPFHDGVDEVHPFDLDLGAQVVAVVPQPVVRGDVSVHIPAALTAADDGKTFVVEDSTILADGTEKMWLVTFEFDIGNGYTSGNRQVLFADGDVPSVVAQSRVAPAIQAAIDAGELDGGRVAVSAAGDTVTLTGPRVLFYPGDTGFTVQSLEQHRNQIEVYFNDDPLDPTAAANTSFYQLIVTNNTATPADDKVIYPDSVAYDAGANKAVLTFTQDLADPTYGGTGAFRLRIGNDYEVITTSHAPDSPVDRAGESFHTAETLVSFGDGLGPESLVISAEINPKKYDLEWPGAVDEPGQRDLPWYPAIQIEDHFVTGNSSPDAEMGITTLYYNFRDIYGYDPQGAPLHNLITEAQKQRAREIFELYGNYLGVQFYETADQGYLIATGDLRAADLDSTPGGVAGVAFFNLDTGYATALMDKAEPWGNSEYAGSWFEVAMHEIGHLMGYGHSYDLPPLTVMGSSEDIDTPAGPAESVYPGDNDIVHGLHMYRPESLDIDLYKFTIPMGVRGTFSAETFAERMNDSSMLDTTLTLYEEYEATENGQQVTRYRVISRNDDYYSEDSYLQMYLQEGTYYVGVTASGNDQYDPNIDNTGIGGVTQGIYDLRLNFTPGGVDPEDPETFKGDGSTNLIDATGTLFDGDADGVPGGAYNFWFNVQPTTDTIFVDKLATDMSPDGSLARPYQTISAAFAAAGPGDIVRIVGNNFDDDAGPTYEGNYTYNDNEAYEIGRGVFNNPLRDGTKMEVPQGVTVMIDAGAMFKLRGANIDVGSSAEGIDRSGGAVQVLGIPGVPVYFTSYYDETLGADTEPNIDTVPSEGNWGGLVFRNDLDYDFIDEYDPASGDPPREVLETQGIFLNYVNHADIRYGGGQVTVHGVRSVYTPIHLLEARPTISFNTITNSADAAISGDPNSFADTKFENWDANIPFTASYQRVGPDIHGNKLKARYGDIDPDTSDRFEYTNTINGVFVRVQTNPGQPIKELEVPGRFDDWDIVHVVSEVLFINGTPGGPILTPQTCPLVLLDANEIEAVDGGSIPDGATFSIADGSTRVVFEFDRGGGYIGGHEPIAYTPGDGRDVIAGLVRDAINKANTDRGLDVTASISGMPNYIVTLAHHGPTFATEGFGTLAARLDARLLVDPGMIVKMDGSRIEAEVGAQFIAEGRIGSTEGATGYKVIFTSLLDNRYGAGGSFNSSENTSGQPPAPGDWAGFYFGPVAEASINNAVIAYGGGVTAIEGGFASFDPVEIHQAHARITNSRFEHNAGASETEADRPGRGFVRPAAIYVRGAQPVIVNNDFLDNDGSIVNINVNSLQARGVPDWGRSTGPLLAFDAYDDNHGPLVRENRTTDNEINGMTVRGGTLTTEVIWDDTDIVHVLRDEVVVPNFHHFGGLRLQSSTTESLVVKLDGPNAGFTAEGLPLEIDDRIGGTIHVVGTPGHPVVLTALADDSVGVGFDMQDAVQFDTNGDGPSQGQPGAWRSIKLDAYSNDRNVAVVNELEQAYGTQGDVNGGPFTAQLIGELAESEAAGDDNLRLGFEIHGNIRYDDSRDVDVYSFDAQAGTEIWLDIDRTTHALDTIVELIDADGKVLARSDNSVDELDDPNLLYNWRADMNVRTMDRDPWLRYDFNTTNQRDAGMRLVLPGPEGQVRTYYVRVRSSFSIGNIPAGWEDIDGKTFTVGDGTDSVTFQFDKPGLPDPTPGNTVIPVTAADDAEAVAGKIAQAVNDAGMQVSARVLGGNVVLDGTQVQFDPGEPGDPGYYAFSRLANTSGAYRLQLRLREMEEVPGSTVRYADIRYATNGVEVLGFPGHSPLLGETAEI